MRNGATGNCIEHTSSSLQFANRILRANPIDPVSGRSAVPLLAEDVQVTEVAGGFLDQVGEDF